jgi:hypothetical protein
MNTLHVFGCSYSAFFEECGYNPVYLNYKKFRGGKYPKVWSELLSEKLDLKLSNNAVSGASNYEIFQLFCDNVESLNEGDIVIIGWSFKERFRLFDNKINKFIKLGPGLNPKVYGLTNNTIDEVLVNRIHPKWLDEIYSWEKLIERTCELIGVKLLIWSFETSFPKHDGFYKTLVELGVERITDETNGNIKDFHFGEKGHIVQSDYFFDVLNNKIIYNL